MGEGNFYETASITADGGIPLKKYKSSNSGITVCIAQAEGPIVAGYLIIATEAEDDDGLPHTLEHLVFLGSQKYPYKGVLDLISNRCLASGTNAWTDTDHTAYTMTTAGHEGFLKLLPIYVDHLLYPSLTDAGYTTEVHHINEDGVDMGIVYCEMQGRENSGESRCHLAMLRAVYPGDCSYRMEVGGLLKNLRESTNNEKVLQFHKRFYRPENLSIIIVGQIEPEDVFRVLQPLEDQIANEGERAAFERPWQSPVPPLPESVTLDVDYPCDESSFGLAMAAWRGPKAKEFPELVAMEALLEYLTGTSISPLQRDLVEGNDPICSHVEYTLIENSESCIYMHFANVPTAKLESFKERLLNTLEKIGDGTEAIDMHRMKTVILKKKLHILSRVESNPHSQLALSLIGDFLYGDTLEDLQCRVRQIPIIDALLEKDEAFWTELLNRYIVNGKHVVVRGNPSPNLAKEMSEEERSRIEKQLEELGSEGLKQKAEILQKAVQQNEIVPPDHVINSISVPTVDTIKYHSIQRSNNSCPECDTNPDFPLSDMPCRFQLDNVRSSFVRMYALLDTADVQKELRLYLPLFVELLVESPVLRDCVLVPYQEVVKELASDTININVSIGLGYSRFFCEDFAQVLCLELMVEEEQYAKGVRWIRELLFQTVFEPSRIKTIANKMVTDVSSIKRQGNKIARLLMTKMNFGGDSNRPAASLMLQHSFLTNLLKTLEVNPDEIVNALNDVRKCVTSMANITMHIGANFPALKAKTPLVDPWKQDFIPKDVAPALKKTPLKQCCEFVNSFTPESNKGLIVGVSCVESTFLFATASCIDSFKHPDYPALLVLLQYLSQVEGPLWKQIRGLGLAYHYAVFVRPSESLIYFHLFKSIHLVNAYKEAEKIIESYLNGDVPWDVSLLESACGSLMYAIISREKTVANVVMQSLQAYFKNIDLSFTKTLLQNILKVTFEDMERVGRLYLKPLFNPQLSKCSICCHSSKVDEIVSGFEQLSREFVVLPSLDDNCLMDVSAPA